MTEETSQIGNPQRRSGRRTCQKVNWEYTVLPDRPAPVIVWFRNDLRLKDNPALSAAVASGKPVICLYVLETQVEGLRPLGGASKWWLHSSLERLRSDIRKCGGTLTLRRGDPRRVLEQLVAETGANQIVWNRRYGAAEREIDAAVKSDLKSAGLTVESHNGSLLTEPWTIKTGSGTHYKVFTPYWRSVRSEYVAPEPCPAPGKIETCDTESDDLASWALKPVDPDWACAFSDTWQPGEAGAHERLSHFLGGPVNTYKADRNRPDLSRGTSGLSPHLRWGEIGPAQVWRATQSAMSSGRCSEDDAMTFLSEIVWREFSYVLLYHHPELANENYNDAFRFMPWRDSDDDYERWCRGRTGYPIVDAGMRQLWQTGWMHNRVRMIVASFLTKHLLLPWQLGEDWFWDTLVDADPASNAAGWQWTAGSGADAAPYFRVFNPITQGQKFDESGDYVRKFCPELAQLPTRYLHEPWAAPSQLLETASIKLGETYPNPMIEHSRGRERALAAYDTLKQKRDAS